MKKLVLVAAVGMMALAGAALASEDSGVIVSGTMHTPAGDIPIDRAQGLPVSSNAPLGATIDDANGKMADNNVPLRLQATDSGLRPDIRCSGIRDVNQEGKFDALCTNEPVVNYPANDIVTIGPSGVHLKDWVKVDSGSVFQYIPKQAADALPAEQAQAIQGASQAVNAKAAATMVDDLSSGAFGGNRPALIVGGEDLLRTENLANLLSGSGFQPGGVGDGKEAKWLGEGVDELFGGAGAPVSTASTDGAPGANAQTSGSVGQGNNDLAGMAIAAAVVGGAILAPLALYHRIRSNNALNNKTRQTVYDAVIKSPGLGVNEAAKAANCSYSTAAYHLERLVEERLLVLSEDGRRARYFKNGGSFSTQEREFVPILQSKECMDVLQVIVENPWCYRAEVAQRLGVSGPTVNWHLKKLMAADVVKEMREGRVSYLYADKKLLNELGANLVGKMPEDLVARLRFERRPEAEVVEAAASLPETTVPDVGLGEIDSVELAPLVES